MIHVLSPNTALEVILGLPRLTPGRVHRATRGLRRVGGKGVNVARACGRMGVSVRLVALVDARAATELPHEPDLIGSTVEMVRLPGSTRTDVMVAEADGRATVVNGVADPVPPAAIARLLDAVSSGLGRGDLLVLAGSLPPGVPVGLYASLVAEARARGARTVVDTSGDWLRAVLPARPDVVKVNLAEFADALHARPRDCWSRGGALVPDVPALVLSRASAGARVWADARRCSVMVPRQAVTSAVGAGDAMTAGVAVGLAAGLPLPDAVVQGAAWGAAAVREFDLTLDPVVVREIAAEARLTGCVPA